MSDIAQPEGLFNTCAQCGQQATAGTMSIVDGKFRCHNCLAINADRPTDGEITLEGIVDMFRQSLEGIATLTAKVDRLDERVCNLVVLEPLPRAEAEKVVDTRVHAINVRIDNLEAEVATLRSEVATEIEAVHGRFDELTEVVQWLAERAQRQDARTDSGVRGVVKKNLRRWLGQ